MADAHPVFARFWARLAPLMEGQGLAEERVRLLGSAAGVVVEVGAGDGANFRHYPPGVSRVVAVEPESRLRARASERAAQAALPVEVVDGVADRLPVPDGSADTVVCCLVLCSVPDQAAALAEARRVLRPGGRLLFMEHVAAPHPRGARVQRAVDRVFWPRLFGGCHTSRDTVGAIRAAGLDVEADERFLFPEGSRLPPAPHARGAATRPCSMADGPRHRTGRGL